MEIRYYGRSPDIRLQVSTHLQKITPSSHHSLRLCTYHQCQYILSTHWRFINKIIVIIIMFAHWYYYYFIIINSFLLWFVITRAKLHHICWHKSDEVHTRKRYLHIALGTRSLLVEAQLMSIAGKT